VKYRYDSEAREEYRNAIHFYGKVAERFFDAVESTIERILKRTDPIDRAIFISYRRDDSAPWARLVYTSLFQIDGQACRVFR